MSGTLGNRKKTYCHKPLYTYPPSVSQFLFYNIPSQWVQVPAKRDDKKNHKRIPKIKERSEPGLLEILEI